MRIGDRGLKLACLSVAMGVGLQVGLEAVGRAQTTKPKRAAAPTFKAGQFEGTFFADPASQLQGEMPNVSSPLATGPLSTANPASQSVNGAVFTDSPGWSGLISPASLEDLVKAGKLRLDKLVTTPTAFKGGGVVESRTEFSLQALLFAIIETYPGDVRWKNSATVARQRFTRVAANTKVGSDQVFTEAKARLLDLGELIGGTPLAVPADPSTSEIDWSNLIDRVPLMQLLEWAHQKNLTKLVASESDFRDNSDAVQRYAELISVLGQAALAEEMPDATDDDYRTLAKAMIGHAAQVVLAVKTNNAELARTAASQIGQACTNCHDSYQ